MAARSNGRRQSLRGCLNNEDFFGYSFAVSDLFVRIFTVLSAEILNLIFKFMRLRTHQACAKMKNLKLVDVRYFSVQFYSSRFFLFGISLSVLNSIQALCLLRGMIEVKPCPKIITISKPGSFDCHTAIITMKFYFEKKNCRRRF